MQPIKRHKFPEFIVSLSVQCYVKLRCGFSGVIATLRILKDLLGWDFESIPCKNSIENWVKKCGYSVYNEPSIGLLPGNYAAVIDESMMVGSEKMLLTLGLKAEKDTGSPIRHEDVKVLRMSVCSSWNAQKIEADLQQTAKKAGRPPSYVISDNASSITNAVKSLGYTHIRDVSHTFGLFMEHIYKQDEEFISFMKELSGVKFREVMKPIAYLLPPKQRTIARFLNLSDVVKWSSQMMAVFPKLTEQEKQTFSFIPRYASFIEELRDSLDCINTIQKEIKSNGLSIKTLKTSSLKINKLLNNGNNRMRTLGEEIDKYIKVELSKMGDQKKRWNASSDIIESVFGTYKLRKSPNPLYGVTSFVLFLPLHAKIGSKEKTIPFDFKRSLENVFLSEIKEWKKRNLTDNLVTKRTKVLQSA